jgi:hypothetical protein
MNAAISRTLRLAYDVGALVGLAGRNVIDGTAAIAVSFVRSAELLIDSPREVPRKPPVPAPGRIRGAAADQRAPNKPGGSARDRRRARR